MKFLVDAQLPRRLSEFLNGLGHDSIHTLDLPAGNRTTDEEINRFAMADSRILVTKDSDFVDTFLTRAEPPKLLLVATGNISNNELLDVVTRNLAGLAGALQQNDFVELTRANIIVHS